jgi:hypothetical protein
MRPDTNAFLTLVRDAEDPTLADEQRVARALRAAVAAGAMPSAGGMPSAPGRLGALGSKLNVIAVCAAAAAGTADTPRQLECASGGLDRSAVTAPAPLPAPSELVPSLGSREERRAASEPPNQAGVTRAPVSGAANAEVRRTPTPLPSAPRAPAPGQPAPPRELGPELALLQRVQAALRRGDPASALAQLDAHQTLDRSLLSEREAARVIALCLLQRTGEARRAARDFSARHPESMHQPAISRACANLQRIGEP